MYNIKINKIRSLVNLIDSYNRGYSRNSYKADIVNTQDEFLKSEVFKDEPIMDDIVDFYQFLHDEGFENMEEILTETDLISKLENYISILEKECYGSIRVDYESYKLKLLLYYTNNNGDNIIAYMAGSFYTDQEYRAFLATIQKGRKRNTFYPVDSYKHNRIYDLTTVKDGYLSRVKKSVNANTQDGYHADFHLNNGRFFLLRENDNPVDIIYKWIVKNTQSAVIEDWKTYLYNTLSEKGFLIECECVNYTNTNLRGIVLSDEVTTELIREIRHEGMSIGEIEIPREPVELDPDMSFIDVMNEFIVPELNEREVLYNVGDKLSPIIESPILFKKGNKIKKSHLYPKQKVITQGMLNGIKAGRHNQIMQLGMGVGKTIISIKLAYATIKEHYKKNNARIAVMMPGHLCNKWERQFREALPDVNLKFFKISNYKDVLGLENKKPEGIEVFLLPRDKVKRKYLEEYSVVRKYKQSDSFYQYYEKYTDKEKQDIYIADTVKPSELRLMTRSLSQCFNKWTCVCKSVYNDEGQIIGYKVSTTSEYLKEKLGNESGYYDFYVSSLDEITQYKEKLDELDKEIEYISNYHQKGLVCPHCGGPIYDSELKQLSEDDYKSNLYKEPKSKTDRNKKCTNYIKADGTPLTTRERNLLIKGELDYVIDDNAKHPYLDSNESPIVDQESLLEVKNGCSNDHYSIVLKRCDTPLWGVKDQKGYRVANPIDMLERKFGRRVFDFSITDEAHQYAFSTNQGAAFSKLCNMSKVNVALTGTLTGGKASHLFYILYRMIPGKMSKYYKFNEVTKFVDHYGKRKRVTKENIGNGEYNKSGVGKSRSTSYSEIAGISPLLYSHFLSDIMVSRKIEDMGFTLPPLKYYKHEVEMSPELAKGYNKLRDDIVSFMKRNKHINLGGTYLNSLLAYPDMPISEPLCFEDQVISVPEKIDIENTILPKEQKLIDTVKKELLLGRRTVVYVKFTGNKAVDRRVEKILKDSGIKVAVLKSSVNTEKREQWIEDRYREGVQIIVTNPKIVETGLDIVQFPNMYFYELDYDVRVVRQAESRAWRLGQEKDCHVYYSYYKDTIAEDALKLIGSKKKASLAIEGVLAEDILSESGDEVLDSAVTALYKSLLGKVKLKEDDLDFFSEEEIIEIVDEETIETTFIENIPENESSQMSLFTITEANIKNISRKAKKDVVVGQVSLFNI